MHYIYKIDNNGKYIKGIGLHAFIHNVDYYLDLIKIYADGTIDCWGTCSFEEFELKIKNGWIVTQLPEKGRVDMFQLFQVDTSAFDTYIEEAEFVKEVKDTLLFLQNKRTSTEQCLLAFENYLSNPNTINQEKVKQSFYAVPKHLRISILGNMSMGDGPLKAIIAGNLYDEEAVNYLKEYFQLKR